MIRMTTHETFLIVAQRLLTPLQLPPVAERMFYHMHEPFLMVFNSYPNRLNMELDLKRFIWAPVCSPPPSSRIWAHIRGRYWSARICRRLDVISL
jgi:hypothetical protein